MPGCVCKPLMADYILYLILPLRRAYLLPVIQLQQAWEINKAAWLEDSRVLRAKNNGYTSYSAAIGINELFPKIGNCFRGDFTSQPCTE